MKKKPFKLLGLVIFLGLIALVTQTLYHAGVFKKVKNFSEGYEVQIIQSPAGIEDSDIDPETNTIFLSSHDRRLRDSTGDIFAMHPGSDSTVNLTKHLKLEEFRPHGISFLNINGNKYLFVISHRNQKNVVMKFLFSGDSLSLQNSYSSTDFSSPNDLFAIGEDAFLLTNDHGTTTGWKKTAADFLRLPVGNVVYFDNGKSTIVLDKIAYPNGVLVYNNDIYVSSTLGSYIGIYKPVSTQFHLEEIKKIKTPHAPDNLMVLDNKIYTGGHPQLLKFSKHAKSSDTKSPSTAFYFENDKVVEIFEDDGNKLSGSSTVLPVKDSLGKTDFYIGSVFESKILRLTPQ